MKTLRATIRGLKPVSQPMPRGVFNPHLRRMVFFRDQRYLNFRDTIKMMCRSQIGRQITWDINEVRAGLAITFHLYSIRRNDIDKLAGTVLDALEGLAYKNDRQVDSLEVNKCEIFKAEQERIEITIFVEAEK